MVLIVCFYFLACILPPQVVEKLVDVVTFIHQEISEAFGDNGMRSALVSFFLFGNIKFTRCCIDLRQMENQY
jgi:hypothetical protein